MKPTDGRAEHADLGVHVTQVRNLHDLRQSLEALVAARAEEAGCRIQHVASVASERRLAEQLHLRPTTRCRRKDALPNRRTCPFACDAVSELSRLRTGLGGGSTCSWKSANSAFAPARAALALPTKALERHHRSSETTALESKGSVPNCPVERSPRQCIAPGIAQAAQGLRGERPLHGMEVRGLVAAVERA